MLLIIAVFSFRLLTAVQRIDVVICNPDGIAEYVISKAKVETELVFRPIRAEIDWHACETSLKSVPRTGAPTFLVRLWNDTLPRTIGPASLDVMGKAFVEEHNGGSEADLYLRTVRATAEEYCVDPDVVLGFVLAHELGHLLLGPVHTRDGVMKAVWGQREIEALRHRQLRFNNEGAKRIRLKLALRSTAEGANTRMCADQ